MLLKISLIAVMTICYICIGVMMFNLFKDEKKNVYAKCLHIMSQTLLLFIYGLTTVAVAMAK